MKWNCISERIRDFTLKWNSISEWIRKSLRNGIPFQSKIANAFTYGVEFVIAFSWALAADRLWHDNITADVSNSLVSEVYSWHVSISWQSDEQNPLRNEISFLSEFANSLRNEISFLSGFCSSLCHEIETCHEYTSETKLLDTSAVILSCHKRSAAKAQENAITNSTPYVNAFAILLWNGIPFLSDFLIHSEMEFHFKVKSRIRSEMQFHFIVTSQFTKKWNSIS